MDRLRPCFALLALLAAGPAAAGEVACHYEGGVIVVPADVAGVEGDYILDTGTPASQIHETRAQTEGLEADSVTGPVKLAGLNSSALTAKVADLDVRTWNLPTAVAGVIGTDALKGWVVEVSYAPCRVRVWRASEAPAFRGRDLPLTWDLGRPTAPASVFDAEHEIEGRFVIATGANAPVRLADDLAVAVGAAKPDELYPNGVWLARLGGVRFAGEAGLDVAAGLMKPDGEAAGVLGGPVLAHFRLRFDFPANVLTVAPAR